MTEATDATDASTETDERTRKAREEPIHVTAHRENANSHTLTVENDSPSGDGTYDVMVSKAAPIATGCSCKDETYNSPDGGCKHRRHVTSLLNVVGTLAEDDYVDADEIHAMVDADADEVDAALAVTADD